jgi:hypothetical protein
MDSLTSTRKLNDVFGGPTMGAENNRAGPVVGFAVTRVRLHVAPPMLAPQPVPERVTLPKCRTVLGETEILDGSAAATAGAKAASTASPVKAARSRRIGGP